MLKGEKKFSNKLYWYVLWQDHKRLQSVFGVNANNVRYEYVFWASRIQWLAAHVSCQKKGRKNKNSSSAASVHLTYPLSRLKTATRNQQKPWAYCVAWYKRIKPTWALGTAFGSSSNPIVALHFRDSRPASSNLVSGSLLCVLFGCW